MSHLINKGQQYLFSILFIFGIILSPLVVKSGIVQAQGLSFPAQINKSFDPISVVAGQISRLSVTIYNPNAFQVDNAAWTDNLVGVQPGIFISNPVNLANNCGGTVTAVSGQTSFSLSEGTVPAQVGQTPGQCTVAIDVTSTTAGNLINTIPIGALNGTGGGGDVSNTTPASATLQVGSVQPPSLSKAFNLNTIFVGATSRLTITLRNNDLVTALTRTAFTDSLPSGVVLAPTVNPVLTGCGGATVTANPGGNTITLNNGTVAVNSTCTVAVNVTASTQGNYRNNILTGSISTQQGVTNGSDAIADLAVQNVGILKAFSPTSIVAGATSTLTITLQNPTGNAYTGVGIADTLPVGLIIGGAGSTNNCGAGVIDYPDGVDNTLGANERTIRLTGGTVPASPTPPTPSLCTISIPVTTPPNASAATLINTIRAGDLHTDQGITNPTDVSANLAITRWLTGTKAFSPASIPAGGTSTVTIALRNNRTNAALTNVNFTDTLPANLSVYGTPTSPQCGGNVTFSNLPAPSTVTLSGGTIAANSTCNIVYQATTSVVASYTNTIPAGDITTGEGASNILISSNSLSVVTAGGPVRVAKAFQTSPIAPGANVRLRITITSPTDMGVTGLGGLPPDYILDTLPTGMRITNSTAPSNGCGGTLTATTGTNIIKLSNGAIANPNTSCNIDVYVTADNAGSYPNTIPAGAVTTDQGRPNTAAANATLVVSGFTMTKAFYPSSVVNNGYSTLTISLVNSSPLPITGVTLLDDLATMLGTVPTSGVYIEAVGNTTCGSGAIDYPDGVDNTLGANERKIRLTGGTIPAKVGTIDGLCTINIDVQGRGPVQTRTNTLPVANASGFISGVPISPRAQAQASLSIANLTIGIVKGFNPETVTGGSASTLSIELTNPNNATLAGIAFTDNMPAGMTVANPANPSPPGSCGGGTLTAVPGASSFSFSGGMLPAASSCTLTLKTTTNVNGNLTNVIPASAVTTTNGAVNPQPTARTLTNLPGASVSKAFAPNPVIAASGDYSVLTITIQNTGSVPLTGMGLIDNLPASLQVADLPAPAPVSHCGGVLTAAAGTRLIQLTNGSLDGSLNCTIVVSVKGTTPGNFQNCIPINSLTNNENVQNHEAACDTLNVLAAPAISLSKSANPGTYDSVGNVISYDYVITNTGGTTLNGPFTVADDKATVTCNAVPVGGLAPNATLSCSATHAITQGDIDAGSLTNTATASGNGLTSNEAIATVNASQNPGLTLTKTAEEPSYDAVGDILHFTITARNSGNVTLTAVSISDAQLGSLTCTPDQPATLAPTATLVCTGSHTVTQADINAGFYKNTANATGTPPIGSPLTRETDITINARQNPSLRLTKTATEASYASIGEILHFTITALNNGNLPLTAVSISDPQLTDLNCTPAQPTGLAPNESLVCTGTHTVSQADINAGIYRNAATATATPPSGPPLTPSTEASVEAVQNPVLTLTKTSAESSFNLAGDILHFTITARNNGNVPLTAVSISDAQLDGLTCNPAQPVDLVPTESLVCTGSHTVTLADMSAGFYKNTASATATPPRGDPLTPSTDITIHSLLDPPLGEKTYDNSGLPILKWTVVWINNRNNLAVPSFASDPVPAHSAFVDNGIDSGYPLPAGVPANSTANGVTCLTDPNSVTTTTACYYEGPTANFPRGRVVWQGILGPDLGATNRDDAVNEIVITFSVRIDTGITSLSNTATISVDQNDDGDFIDPGEVDVASASDAWNRSGVAPAKLPETGFAPGRVTLLPDQPLERAYADYSSLTLEIPSLNIKAAIVGIPIKGSTWDVSWLGSSAGWLQGTTFPTWAGNSVLTGHVWNADNTPGPFLNVKNLGWGDLIIIHAWGQKYVYQVQSVVTIKPDSVSQIMKHETMPWITLLTCGDFNEKTSAYRNRVMIRAVQVRIEAE